MDFIYYFYKITNTVNGKVYYGVHRQDPSKVDSYMGSGVALFKAKQKYGIYSFQKEILKYFSSEEEMYAYEQAFISREFLQEHSTDCYNLAVGGQGGVRGINLPSHKWTYEQRKRQSERMKIWAKENPDSIKKFLSAGSESLKGRVIPEEQKKLASVRSKAWHKNNPEKSREVVETMLKSSEEFRFTSENSSGYDNLDFKKRWEPIYLKGYPIYRELSLFSNLEDADIVELAFEKSVKIDSVSRYFLDKGLMPSSCRKEIQYGFTKWVSDRRLGHISSGKQKTHYIGESLKYEFAFLFEDFFEDLPKILILNRDDSVSDSSLVQGKDFIPLFKQKIAYFKFLGIIKNEEQKQIIAVGTSRSRRTIKTVYSFDFKALNKILIDKEFNTYGIDDDGKPFQKGRFRLEVDGIEYSLRYKR